MFPSRRFKHGDWDDWSDRIDDGDLSEYVKRELQNRGLFLSDTDVKQNLGDLRNVWRYGGREDRLVNMMQNKLSKDLDSSRHQGLYRTRSRFLTFCFVARRMGSDELARGLLRFYAKEQTEILEEEESFLLTEWCLALQQLEGLVSQDKLMDAFRKVARLGPPMFEQWNRSGPHHSWVVDLLRLLHDLVRHERGRGRDEIQLLAPRDLPARRLSVPAFRRPSYRGTGYNTPLVTPRISHEVNALHLQQHVQGYELERLRRDMENMIYRY